MNSQLEVLLDDLVYRIDYLLHAVLLPDLESVLDVPVVDIELAGIDRLRVVVDHKLELVLRRLAVDVPVGHVQSVTSLVDLQNTGLVVAEEHPLLQGYLVD